MPKCSKHRDIDHNFFFFSFNIRLLRIISFPVSKQSGKVASWVFKTQVPGRNRVSNTRDPELQTSDMDFFPHGATLKSSF